MSATDRNRGGTAAIIVAAGRGMRAGGSLPKQYRDLAGLPVLVHTLRAFARHPAVDRLIVVLNPADQALFDERIAPHCDFPLRRVAGGATRGASVRAGLAAADGSARVLIHDGARPLVAQALISEVIAALGENPAAAPALPVTDALWRGTNGRVQAPHPRAGLFRAQTPQGFRLPAILAAHENAPPDAADDVEVALAAGLDVAITEGDENNLKITFPADFRRAEQLMRAEMDIRTGNGFDVHAFAPGDHVTLCGVRIPHERGLAGHSDADVGMHALTDAIYGALAEGDIGRHFPPSDPRWKGAASDIFLLHAIGLAGKRGYRMASCDVTLVCEIPKISPHADTMRARLAEIMRADESRISVKATTSERLGFTGRGEGIAALATATLVRP